MDGIKEKIREKWYLRWILICTNWVAQGIINADKTEKIYKISFSLFFTLILYFLLSALYPLPVAYSIMISFIIAHTLNWFINGNISTILLHRMFIGKLNKEKAFFYLKDLSLRLENNNSIVTCAVFGSIARGELKPSSDIDITFVRTPGFLNAIKSIFFMITEKYRTNVKLIPIEAFLVDSIGYMKKRYRSDEIPIIIKDISHCFSKFYEKTQTIEEAFQGK